MSPDGWRLLRSAVLLALAIGAVLGASTFVLWTGTASGWIGAHQIPAIPFTALVGALVALPNALVAALAGLGARRLGATDRAAVSAATAAVLLGWGVWALVVALDGDGSAVILVVGCGLAAALCTAISAWAVLRRARRAR